MGSRIDPQEKKEWIAALEVLIEERGKGYGEALLSSLANHIGYGMSSPYWNSGFASSKIEIDLAERASALIRWNAMMMVLHAGEYGSEIGGHLSTFASSYVLMETGNNVFFRGSDESLGDLVLYQGHASPGNYARSYLLDQLSLEQIQHFRREVEGRGISSYPHPWLMPNYWQFPTVSMGLGPLQAIYHAKLMRYMESRGFLEPSDRRVFAFLGDGEMDEVESLGALGVASRENLDNLIFIVNCNLVRLDGPCRGNGQIIQELGQYFAGYGWQVIKLVWSQAWLDLVEKDDSGYLQEKLMGLLDGQIQALYAKGSLKAWFLEDPKLAKLVVDFKEADFDQLLPGGHDWQLVANAYQTAIEAKKPAVILAMTEKGYGFKGVASKNISHNQKSLSKDQIQDYSQFLKLDKEISGAEFYHPGWEDERIQYLMKKRELLGGHLPKRRERSIDLKILEVEGLLESLRLDVSKGFSTTMGFVKILNILLRDNEIKSRIVPIVADEGRTLGMEGLFSKIGIYQSGGQQYTPHDKGEISYYKEMDNGQLIQEGLNEAGAMAMWNACATAYSVHDCPLIPIYAYYSMFGFQRVGDMIYAAADSRARGFLMGGTAGKTTLGGEGLQHNDGTSLLIASTIPNCKSYDPCYTYEMAVIMQDGMKKMYQQQQDVFYYLTMMNENYPQPPMPKGVEKGILKGMYCLESRDSSVDLLASGAILQQAIQAAEWLLHEAGIAVNVWSVTSYCELYRDAEVAKREKKTSYLQDCLQDSQLVVACSDYVKALPGLIHEHVERPFVTLGTDGFGMSDTRESLRDYFGVSKAMIAKCVVWSMVDVSLLEAEKAEKLVGKLSGMHPLMDDRRKDE